MGRNGVQAASARRGTRPRAILALVLAGLALPAQAGDRALLDPIGYSPDGRYFAFEEYGIRDGSGFPYSSIYLVDLPADAWVKGSPVRVSLEDENASLASARARARREAEDGLARLDITEPAQLIALNGDGEAGDGLSLAFGAPGHEAGALLEESRLGLEIFAADSPEDCETYLGEKPKGFGLVLEDETGKHALHRDGATLPASRGCPLTYRIYGVVARPDTGSLESAVAIVAVYPHGFEGPDRRFLAVPLHRP